MGSSLILPSSAPGSPVLVRDVGGYPLPPSEIVERCKRIHPALNLRFADGIGGVGWSITWEWPASDRRWAWVQDGRTDPDGAYDRIGYLPIDCSIDEAPAYIERCLKDYPREEVSRLTERMHHWNHVSVPEALVSKATADTMSDYARDQRAPVNQVVSVPSGPVKSRRSA